MDVYAKHRPPAGTFFRSAVAFIAAFAALSGRAADFYVRPPGTTSTDASPYNTWDTAATQIQWAVNVAMTNLPATVWVTNGTYRVTNEVAITNGVTLKSVSGYTKTLVCADWPTYTTRVFNIANRAAVDGFAISNGHVTTNVLTVPGYGGGVYMASTSVLRNCYVLHNVALNSHGGGIFSAGGAIVSNCIVFSNMLFRTAGVYHGGGINAGGPVIGCTIVSNWSDSYAGGVSGDMCPVMSNCAIVYNTGQATGGGRGATLTTDCLISNNTGYSWGGGLELVLNATIRNSTIVNNYAGAAGGGLRVLYQATITNCIIANNRCANAGAGVYVGYVWNASVSNRYIVDCQISNNLSLGGVGGGGVAIQDTGQMRNCLVHHNTNTAGNGGGIRLINATAWSQFDCGVINCTVADNYSLAEGGGIAASGVSNLVINCVVAGNRSLTNSYPNVFHADSAGANSSNYYHTCAVTTDAYLFAAGQFNITNDPLYAVGSYRLGNGSPCINNGLNQNWMTGARDLDGAPRVRYGFVDMGAYERSHEATIYNFH